MAFIEEAKPEEKQNQELPFRCAKLDNRISTFGSHGDLGETQGISGFSV